QESLFVTGVSQDILWEMLKYMQPIDIASLAITSRHFQTTSTTWNAHNLVTHQGISNYNCFSDCLIHNCALIGGPCIMASWYPSTLDSSHLEIYCTSIPTFHDNILLYLQTTEGFHIMHTAVWDSATTSSRKFAFIYPEFSKTVKAVHTLTKKKIRESGHSKGKYQGMVITSMFWSTALPPILELPNTMFMTYFTGKELCTLYPLHTLCGDGIMNFDGPVNTHSIPATQ
ncbi:hypothetical protein FA15DRAFT_599931, partial [Coprinopsis marcescibilis]